MATTKALDTKYGISVNSNDFVDSSRNITSTTINKVTITAPAASATLTIANGKTLTVSNTLTFTGTDASSVAFGAGGTVAYTGGNLSQFAATTSSQLAGVISDETGSGALVFATSPTLVTPTLGVATATSINKVTITAPATSSTLTIADGKTLTVSNTLTFTGTDASSVAFGAGGTVAYTGGNLSQFAATTSSQLAGVISDETGSGALVFGTSPAFTTSVTTGSASFDVFNTTATTVNAFGAATALALGATSGTTTVRNNLVVAGNLQVDGTTTIVNSTVTSLDDPILVLGGDTATAETTRDRGIEFKWGGATATVTSYTGNGTTTVTAAGGAGLTTGWVAGDIITISGATGTEQAKLNGTWTIASVPSGTSFTFVVSSTVAAGALSTNLGTTVRSRNGFFGLDQSTQRFTFIPQASNSSEAFSGTVGDIEIGDLYVTGGDIFSGAAVASTLFSTTTTGNVSLANGLTTGTLTLGSANGSGTIAIGNTGTAAAQAVNIATATTGTITIGGTGATAVQLPTGKTKIGTSFLAEGSAFTYSLPTHTANATIAITANKLSAFAATTSAELAGVISDETGSGVLVFGTSPAFTTSVTTGSASFDVFNTNATTVNFAGAATTLTLANTGTGARTINVATAATGGASTLTFGGAVSGNTLKVASTAAGSISLTTDVTTGIANIFTSVTGTVNIGGVNSNVYLGTQTALSGNTATVATISQTAVDTFSATTFRSCEYLVQIAQGSAYQISKILLVHDGSTAYITEYGTITSGSILGTLDADVTGGNVRLLVTMGSATSSSVKTYKTAIVV
jgi:hypothetical protein